MKVWRSSGRTLCICLLALVVVLILVPACAQPATPATQTPTTAPAQAPAKQFKMKWVSVAPASFPGTKLFQKEFIDVINTNAKGELVIDFAGGPEVIGTMDQGSATKQGIVDISAIPCGFYEPLAPGIGGAMLTQISTSDERKPGGGYDYLVELHKKGGLMYLGRGVRSGVSDGRGYFSLFSNKLIEKPEDFKGLKIGHATAARPAVAAWGATGVMLKMEDYYPAVERGLVDGVAGCPIQQWVALGCHEKTKYCFDHPFYEGTQMMLMNLASWNTLPKNLQQIVIDAAIRWEGISPQSEKQITDAAIAKMTAAGVQMVKFSPDMANWFMKTAYDAAWAFQQERFPDVTPKLKQLLSK